MGSVSTVISFICSMCTGNQTPEVSQEIVFTKQQDLWRVK